MNLTVQGPVSSGIIGASFTRLSLCLSMIDPPLNRDALRQQLRQCRRALSPSEQQQAANHLLKQLMKLPAFIRAQHLAVYLPSDGEIDTRLIIAKLWAMNKFTYLPVVHPNKPRSLWFVHFDEFTPLQKNRFGIEEPNPFTERRLPAQLLDVVLLPLVGFDRQGMRLGMGGGFYDKSFSFKQTAPKRKPHLIGLAHYQQEVEEIPCEPWDIPLTAIATSKEIILISN